MKGLTPSHHRTIKTQNTRMTRADLADRLHRPPSPIVALDCPLAAAQGVGLWVKRDDLLFAPAAPALCGNKWRKLKHNLLEAQAQGLEHLLTFGGAYSNHIAAVAAAGHWLGWHSTGIIRGEPHHPLNPTLQRATEQGMALHYLDRTQYRAKAIPPALAAVLAAQAPHYLIPEGGSNALALKGCEELAHEIQDQCRAAPPTHLLLACGTGGTMAGLVAGTPAHTQVLGVPVLKGGFMADAVADFLAASYPGRSFPHWLILDGYHRGGYAKSDEALRQFIQHTHAQHGIPTEPVYTGKLFMACHQLLEQHYFPPGSRVLLLHTGGIR